MNPLIAKSDFHSAAVEFFSDVDKVQTFFFSLNLIENKHLPNVMGSLSEIFAQHSSGPHIDREHFLNTIMFLAKDKSFDRWQNFFQIFSQIESAALFKTFMHTTGFIACKEHFVSWDAYFEALPKLLKQQEQVCDLFLRTIRKIVLHFSTQESLSSIIRTLSTSESENDLDAFSQGQVKSKIWLIETLKLCVGGNLGRVQVVGGWMGVLPMMLFNSPGVTVKEVLSVDMDEQACKKAEVLNRAYLQSGSFKALCLDVTKDDWIAASDLVINTSCEHFGEFSKWWAKIPQGNLVALQSNNAFGFEGHSNCVENLEEFKSKVPMTQILYSGKLNLYGYDRFMLIGRK